MYLNQIWSSNPIYMDSLENIILVYCTKLQYIVHTNEFQKQLILQKMKLFEASRKGTNDKTFVLAMIQFKIHALFRAPLSLKS